MLLTSFAVGLTKTDLYTAEQNELAEIHKALGHPARVAIIQQLLAVDCCICGDFAREIALAQPTISKHLQILKGIGIIRGTIEGTSMSYCIDPRRWRDIQTRLNQLFDTYASDQDCAC